MFFFSSLELSTKADSLSKLNIECEISNKMFNINPELYETY